MVLDHGRELLIGLETLELQGLPPLFKEASCPTRRLVIPELPERLLEEVRPMQPLVGLEQELQGGLAAHAQVVPARQQGVLLPLDEAAARPRQAGVFALADLIQGGLQ